MLLAEHSAAGTSYLIYGPGNTPIYQVTTSGDVMYYHQDHLGSTRLTTNANGTSRGVLTYDAYGDTKSNTNPWFLEQPLLTFAGEQRDAETGLMYLRARYYDPLSGQFLSWDPLGARTLDPYGYAVSNPGNMTGPTGLFGWDPVSNFIHDRVNDGDRATRFVGESAREVGHQAWEHRDTLVSAGAILARVGSVGAGCIVATGFAVSVRSQMRFEKHGVNSRTVGLVVFDGLYSYGTLGLVKGPAYLATGKYVDTIAPAGSSAAESWIANRIIDFGLPVAMGGFGGGARWLLDRRLEAGC